MTVEQSAENPRIFLVQNHSPYFGVESREVTLDTNDAEGNDNPYFYLDPVPTGDITPGDIEGNGHQTQLRSFQVTDKVSIVFLETRWEDDTEKIIGPYRAK